MFFHYSVDVTFDVVAKLVNIGPFVLRVKPPGYLSMANRNLTMKCLETINITSLEGIFVCLGWGQNMLFDFFPMFVVVTRLKA